MKTAVGVADHMGWGEFVTVRRTGDRFEILARRHVPLIEPGLASAPYHHEGLVLPRPEVAKLLRATTASIHKLCQRELEHQMSAYGARAITLQASPYPELPEDLDQVLASYQFTCAADGMLYRETIADTAAALGLTVVRTARKSDRMAAAAESLGLPQAAIAEILGGFKQRMGAPWKKEHQEAAASALALLGQGGR